MNSDEQFRQADDLPVAMESEFYVDGKVYIKSKDKKKNKNKKKNKKHEANYMKDFLSLFRVLWATRQTEDIDKEKYPDKYTKITLRELILYLIFLVVLSIPTFGMISSQVFNFGNLMINTFVTAPNQETEPIIFFNSITKLDEIWRVLRETTVPGLYSSLPEGDNPANVSARNLDLTKYVVNENRMIGLARLRQVRVMSNSCVIPDDFKQEIRECYSDWAVNTEDKSPYGPYISENATNITAWFYQTEKQLKGNEHQGIMNKYGGGGYVINLSSDQNGSMAVIDYLFRNRWIDRGTRAVFVDFTVYNANINLFCQVRLVFELPATGGVVPSFVMRPVKLLRYVSTFDYFILVCECIYAAFILYYIVEEIIEIKKHGSNYFKQSVWNCLDVIIIGMSIVCIVFNLYRQVKVDTMLESLLNNDEQYFDFDFLCYWQTNFNSAVGAIVFLAWIKIFKYVSFNKTMTQLSLTLSKCAKDVVGFAIMFFIVFLAYAQLGYLIFGTQVQNFSTFAESIFTLFRIILGDFDFEALEAANRVMGPMFFLTYVFFVFFVLLNMFIAIINDTYAEIKADLDNQKSEIELGAFFKRGYDRVLNKLNLKQAKIIDIQKAITCADLNKDNKIDFVEWRNSLRTKGYGDVEIEALFAKYDVDGDRCLNEEEQKNMMKDLADQNEELKKAYMEIEEKKSENEETEVKKKKRANGVLFDDFTELSSRVDKMENTVGTINNKIDAVLTKLDKADAAAKNRSHSSLGTPSDEPRLNLIHPRGFSGNSQSHC